MSMAAAKPTAARSDRPPATVIRDEAVMLALQQRLQVTPWLTPAPVLSRPRFRQGQTVQFVGGSGTIQDYRCESGTWTYLVEMLLGPEPEMGRIGSETTIVLYETDIREAKL
jgi:hypothetical protein